MTTATHQHVQPRGAGSLGDLKSTDRALQGSWRDGYSTGYRHGYYDREFAILAAAGAAARAVGKGPLAEDVARSRARTDRSDVAWDAYTVTGGERVWDADARGALLAWCLADWEAVA